MIKYCTKCGEKNIDVANYCQTCGSKFIDLITGETRIAQYEEMVDSDDTELKNELYTAAKDFFSGYFENTYMNHEIDNLSDIYGDIAIKGKVGAYLDNANIHVDLEKVFNKGMLDFDVDTEEEKEIIYYKLSDPMKKRVMLWRYNISQEDAEYRAIDEEQYQLSKKNSGI